MVTFKNGKQYETASAMGGTEFFQSAERKTLDLIFAADTLTLDEAKSIWKNEAMTAEMTVEHGGDSSVQLNFTLPVSLTMTVLDGDEVIRMKLAQRSALEIAVEKQAQDIRDNEAALCELASLIDGGENNG